MWKIDKPIKEQENCRNAYAVICEVYFLNKVTTFVYPEPSTS